MHHELMLAECPDSVSVLLCCLHVSPKQSLEDHVNMSRVTRPCSPMLQAPDLLALHSIFLSLSYKLKHAPGTHVGKVSKLCFGAALLPPCVPKKEIQDSVNMNRMTHPCSPMLQAGKG